ncbi:MAG: hypothetical protein F6J92_32560 [Symploca sp. SIO1A3]|nr:hypothetical protein [Symploca sp. SIO1A3]
MASKNWQEQFDLETNETKQQMLSYLLANLDKTVSVRITLEALEELKKSDYKLCFAKKVGDFEYNVVWQSYTNYLHNNYFSWKPMYQLFGSNKFEGNLVVHAMTNFVRIGLGQTSVLSRSGILSDPITSGPDTSITMQNNYGSIHPGISQFSESNMGGASTSTPIYVAERPVFKGEVQLTPVEKVLIWFEQNIETGTMFSTARSLEIEVDLTYDNSKALEYTGDKWVFI